MVTPQFHVRFDDNFDICKKGSDIHLPKSQWQVKTYFQKSEAEQATNRLQSPSIEAPAESTPVPQVQSVPDAQATATEPTSPAPEGEGTAPTAEGAAPAPPDEPPHAVPQPLPPVQICP